MLVFLQRQIDRLGKLGPAYGTISKPPVQINSPFRVCPANAGPRQCGPRCCLWGAPKAPVYVQSLSGSETSRSHCPVYWGSWSDLNSSLQGTTSGVRNSKPTAFSRGAQVPSAHFPPKLVFHGPSPPRSEAIPAFHQTVTPLNGSTVVQPLRNPNGTCRVSS